MDPNPDSTPFTWISASRTDVGMVRQVNEDACLDLPGQGLWAVADGMGGHAAGDVASQAIVEQLAGIAGVDSLSDLVDAVEDRLLAVNARLREIATRLDDRTVGSTVAVLMVRGTHAVCMWAGDSRVYRHRDGRLEQLTQDHAIVEDLVEQGLLSREESAGHPQANLVTRAVGATDELHLDLEIFELRDGDTFVLCSDGLDKEADGDEIAATVAGSRAPELPDALVELALSRGSRDNVTVVAVNVAGAGVDIPGGAPDGSGETGSEVTIPGAAGGTGTRDA